MSRFLGIDYGESKIGLALGDNDTKLVLPYKIVKAENFLDNINKLIEDESIDEVVLGLPKNLDNQDTKQTNIVYDFSNKLKKIVNLPIHFEDERMTSVLGKKLMADKSPQPRTRCGDKRDEDASAAALILETFLKRNYGN